MDEKRLSFFLLFNFIFTPVNAITSDALVTDLVFLDIDIDGKEVGTIIIGLFGATTPKTVQNFISLSTEEYGYGYHGSIFHRIIPNFMMQGGDFTNSDGTGGYSIYGRNFRDENFIHKHYGAGWVCMANAGPDTNGSQFYITFIKTPWIDGTHTCFGKVLFGMDVVRICEGVQTDANDRPLQKVEIFESGILPVKKPYLVSKSESVIDELDDSISTMANYQYSDDEEEGDYDYDDYDDYDDDGHYEL